MSTLDLNPVIKTSEFKCPKCEVLVKIPIDRLTNNSQAQTYYEGNLSNPKTASSQWYSFKCPHCEQQANLPSEVAKTLNVLPQEEQKKMRQSHIWLE
jgi:hypothetical protein